MKIIRPMINFLQCTPTIKMAVFYLFLFFMHLADAFIQSHFFEPTTFCAANAMLYHWATGTVRTEIPTINKKHRNSNLVKM